jgi:hypothetical protein
MRALSTFAVLAALAAFVPTAAPAEATSTRVVYHYPVQFTTFVSCINGGAGEWLALDGSIEVVRISTLDASGAQHLQELTIQQAVSGVGLESGDRYHAVGAHLSGFNAAYGGSPSETHLINSYHLIGVGGGAVLAVHVTTHVTWSATGELTARVENVRIVCGDEPLEE